MIDVAEAIDDESEAVTFQAPAAGSYNTTTGKAEFGAVPDPVSGFAAIQPASGRMLQDLPEGLRSEVSMVGWSRTMVALKWEITYGGEVFRVVHVWPRPVDGFNKFALQRAQG